MQDDKLSPVIPVELKIPVTCSEALPWDGGPPLPAEPHSISLHIVITADVFRRLLSDKRGKYICTVIIAAGATRAGAAAEVTGAMRAAGATGGAETAAAAAASNQDRFAASGKPAT